MTSPTSIQELQETLKDMAPIHFVGVNGSGMRPLAEFVASLGVPSGFAVSGSDVETFSGQSSVAFAVEGSPASFALLDKAKTVVYSSAITKNHPTLIRASHKNTLHRSELLSLLTRHYQTIAVAGTHGKSTTSALITHALKALGQDPSWIIGAPFANGQLSFGRGESALLVIEADESDGSFLRYFPTVAVLNNIEADHMDFYLSVGRLEQAFETYIHNVTDQGGIVYWQDSAAVLRSVGSFSGRSCSFGVSAEARMRVLNVTASGLSTTADISFEGRSIALNLPLPGQHNVLNALAAISACYLVGISAEAAALALGSFPGVTRRLQCYPTQNHTLVFDDYAHNPGKIRGCLEGLTAAFPDKTIIAVFQPHRFSRIASLYEEFVGAFRGFRVKVVVVPVYSSGETFVAGFDVHKIAQDIENRSAVKTFSAPTLKHAAELVKSIMNNADDLVVTLGAGDVWRVAEDLSRQM